MKTLYLHIGTPKTASSSIQVFCRMNRRKFHQYGYEFPIILPKYTMVRLERNAHFLTDSSPKLDTGNQREDPVAEAADAGKKRQRNLTKGLSAVHKAFQKYDYVILSDESLWLSLSYNQRNPLEILCEDAEKFNYSIKVIVYLRRQDQFLISRWDQFIKEGSCCQTFAEYFDDVLSRRPLILDYGTSVDRISTIIGKQNVVVRRFVPSTWVGGSVYTDFLNAIGMDEKEQGQFHRPKANVNMGLQLNLVEIQRRINAEKTISKEKKEYLSYCLKKTAAKNMERLEYSLLSQQETLDLLSKYEEGNARIAKEYLHEDGLLFQGEVKASVKWSPNNEDMEADMNEYLSILSGSSLSGDVCIFRMKSLLKKILQYLLSHF